MNPVQKIAAVVLLTVVLVVGFWQGQVIRRQRSEIAALVTEKAVAQQRLQQLNSDNDDDSAKLQALQADLQALKNSMTAATAATSDPAAVALQGWMNRVKLLRARFEQTPAEKIPEMQFLSEDDWLSAAKLELVTEQDYRRAMSRVRQQAESKLVALLQPAVSKYTKANNGAFPSDVAELQVYLEHPLEDAITQRLEIIPASQVPYLRVGGTNVITLKATPVDSMYDVRFVVGDHGAAITGYASQAIGTVMAAFHTATNGQLPASAAQLLPYATTPEQQAAVQEEIKRDGGR